MRNALIDALRRQSETDYRKLFSVVTLLQFLSLGYRLFPPAFSSFSVFLLTNTLPGPSASEVTTLWRYTNLFFTIVIYYSIGSSVFAGFTLVANRQTHSLPTLRLMLLCSVFFAVLDPRVGHSMDVLGTFSIYPCPLSF